MLTNVSPPLNQTCYQNAAYDSIDRKYQNLSPEEAGAVADSGENATVLNGERGAKTLRNMTRAEYIITRQMELRPSIIVNLSGASKDSRTGNTGRSARQLQSKENYGGIANMAIDALEAGSLYRNFGSLCFPQISYLWLAFILLIFKIVIMDMFQKQKCSCERENFLIIYISRFLSEHTYVTTRPNR